MNGMAGVAGYVSRSQQEQKASSMVFYFLMANVFFMSVLSGSLLDQIGKSFSNPGDVPSRLAGAVSARVSSWIFLSFSCFFLFYFVYNDNNNNIHVGGLLYDICFNEWVGGVFYRDASARITYLGYNETTHVGPRKKEIQLSLLISLLPSYSICFSFCAYWHHVRSHCSVTSSFSSGLLPSWLCGIHQPGISFYTAH